MSTWRGVTLASRGASYYHNAEDFADRTLCDLMLTGLSEDKVTKAMHECPRCSMVAAIRAELSARRSKRNNN